MKSKKIDFHKLNNVRDLGGMVNTDGKRIRDGSLIRSGELFGADESDVRHLSELAEIVIDMRTDLERAPHPDPEIPGIENIVLPIIENIVPGITREQGADVALMEVMTSPEGARDYMIETYLALISEETAAKGYSEFLRMLCEPRKKAILWHCTAGKDRAGFAAAIIEHILGMDRDTIMEDYLYTNECIFGKDGSGGPSIDNMMALGLETVEDEEQKKKMKMFFENNMDKIMESIEYLFGAKEEYLQALFDEIDKRFGSFDDYLTKELGVDKALKDKLRYLYLEK